MIVYVENSEESIDNLLELIREFSNIIEYIRPIYENQSYFYITVKVKIKLTKDAYYNPNQILRNKF